MQLQTMKWKQAQEFGQNEMRGDMIQSKFKHHNAQPETYAMKHVGIANVNTEEHKM